MTVKGFRNMAYFCNRIRFLGAGTLRATVCSPRITMDWEIAEFCGSS